MSFVPRKVGPYRLDDLIGRGGMGEVYRAYDERLDRLVAIKHLRSDRQVSGNASRRLRREAVEAVLSQLQQRLTSVGFVEFV